MSHLVSASRSSRFHRNALLILSTSGLLVHMFLVVEKRNGRDHLEELSKQFFAEMRSNLEDEDAVKDFDELMDTSKAPGIPPFLKLLLRGGANGVQSSGSSSGGGGGGGGGYVSATDVEGKSGLEKLIADREQRALERWTQREMQMDQLQEHYDIVQVGNADKKKQENMASSSSPSPSSSQEAVGQTSSSSSSSPLANNMWNPRTGQVFNNVHEFDITILLPHHNTSIKQE